MKIKSRSVKTQTKTRRSHRIPYHQNLPVEIHIVKRFKTDYTKKKGLMFKKKVLGDSCGALFPSDAHGVWMKNTYIPLDAIVFDNQHKVLETVQNMTPLSEKVHRFRSKNNAGFIEVDAGFVKRHRIHKGTQIRMRDA